MTTATINSTREELLLQLLSRGDEVALKQGKLLITPKSGNPIPIDWLTEHQAKLTADIVSITGAFGLTYLSYSTGNYGDRQYPGLTLQFCNTTGLHNYHAIFNAKLTRARNTQSGKANTALPKNHFRVGQKHLFVKFWQQAGLDLPRRLSAFHDRMGNLKTITFSANARPDGRLDCESIQPLDITFAEILQALKTVSRVDNSHTKAGHPTHNVQTKTPDKEYQQHQGQHGFLVDQTTGDSKYETSQQEETSIREGCELPDERQELEDYSTTEWLRDYDHTSRHS